MDEKLVHMPEWETQLSDFLDLFRLRSFLTNRKDHTDEFFNGS